MVLKCPAALQSLAGLFSTDYCTYTQSVHVCILGSGMVRHALTIDEQVLRRRATGLLLHDIGKGLISADVLCKPGPLDDDEWAAMKQHPATGRELLRDQHDVDGATLRTVHEHHEKRDGSGYPTGLRGNQLDAVSRIAGVVDTYDALTRARPYRPAMTHERAVSILFDEAASGKLDGNAVAGVPAIFTRPNRRRRRDRQATPA